MPVYRWFVIDATDEEAARRAWLDCIAAAAAGVGLGDLAPTSWVDAVDVPAERANALLPPKERLPAGGWVRFDLVLGTIPNADGTGLDGYFVNMLVTRYPEGDETLLGNVLTNYWLSQPVQTRQPGAGKKEKYPAASSFALRPRAAPSGVTVSLLAANPAEPRCVFAGLAPGA